MASDSTTADLDEAPKRRGRPRREDAASEPETQPAKEGTRGVFTPVQYDDDGWGDTPVQARS